MMGHEGFDFLGFMVKDVVSNVTGVATSLSFDLYGCIQVLVRPQINDKGEIPEAHWFDLSRLMVISSKRVMEPVGWISNYDSEDTPGPEIKPIQ